MRTLSLLLLAVVVAVPLVAQQTEEQPVVYVSQYRVPWDRVDSLTALLRLYPQWRTKAIEQGHILDDQTLVHLHGDEWNVVTARTFKSWDAFANQKPGWGGEVFRMVEPDSTKRAAVIAGFNWVYQGTIHRDNIYTRPKQ